MPEARPGPSRTSTPWFHACLLVVIYVLVARGFFFTGNYLVAPWTQKADADAP